jgi:hypothetical protein
LLRGLAPTVTDAEADEVGETLGDLPLGEILAKAKPSRYPLRHPAG